MEISVNKYGGTVLASESGFMNMCKNINSSNVKSVFIISALGQTSSNLKQTLLYTENKNYSEAASLLNQIFDNHIQFAKTVLNEIQFSNFTVELKSIIYDLNNILRSVEITEEITDKTYDRFLAFGEDMSMFLIKCYFSNSLNAGFIDSREIIRTDSNYKSASPDMKICRNLIINKLLPQFYSKDIVFVQGFIGSDANGNSTTMGFESSNLTATIIAGALDATELTIWSDVDGIYNADPKIFPGSVLLNKLNYSTAYCAGIAGLKLIYPEMIKIAKEKGIKVIFRNGLNLSDNFTIIDAFAKVNPAIFIISILECRTLESESDKAACTISPLQIISGNLICFSKEINRFYKLENIQKYVSHSEIDESKLYYTEIKIINPDKKLIIQKLSQNFSDNIDRNTIRIDTGFSDNFMSISLLDPSNNFVDDLIKKLA